jgi:DHA3 family tetracycline resistance protein-like MFS transporter
MLEPLRIRDFALLWTGMSVSLVGDGIFLVALAWQVSELSNDPSALGWILAAYMTPLVVFVLAGGVLTDRIERRKMMVAADVIRALAIGTAGALAIAGVLELWQLAICAAATGLGDALFAPAFGSIVPELVPREALAQANALDQFVRPIAGVIGPALAGLLIAVSGAGVALVVDAATFGASTATALMLAPRPLAAKAGRSAWRDVREGFAFVRARPWLWATLLVAGLLNASPAARNVLLPFVVKDDLHASAAALGAIYSATAVGALSSALVYGQRGLPRRHVLVMYVGWSCSGFVTAGYGIATGVGQMVALGFVAGAGIALGQAIWGTLMHRLVPRELLGRVTSVDWLLSGSTMPLAMIAAGFVGDAIGPSTTLVVAGLCAGCLTLLSVAAIPGVRDPEREASGELGEPLGERVQP